MRTLVRMSPWDLGNWYFVGNAVHTFCDCSRIVLHFQRLLLVLGSPSRPRGVNLACWTGFHMGGFIILKCEHRCHAIQHIHTCFCPSPFPASPPALSSAAMPSVKLWYVNSWVFQNVLSCIPATFWQYGFSRQFDYRSKNCFEFLF